MSNISAALRFRRVGPWALAALLCCTSGLAQAIRQFSVSQAEGIALGPDGAMWFTSSETIGRIDTSGSVTEFPLLTGIIPQGIAAGSDGNLWFTEAVGGIGRITASGTVTHFPLSGPVSRPYGITSAPDGNLWFTNREASWIGRITTSGKITEFPVSTPSAGILGIAAGPDSNLWFAESTGNKIGRITPAGVVTEFALPTADSRPTALAAGPDGNLWFTEEAFPRVGRISPTGEITEFPVSGSSRGVVVGTDGNLWFSRQGVLSRVTTSGVVTEFSLPLYDPSPLGIAAAPDGAVWVTGYRLVYGDWDWPTIARISLDTSACVADATTLCLNGGRFRVTADWTDWSAGDGSTGHGHSINLTANSGYFWFFDAANVETVVKVLDGCSANQHHWVFAAGLTNVEVTTTVTDTYTGLSKTYTNPQGTPFAPIQDTTAFATCP